MLTDWIQMEIYLGFPYRSMSMTSANQLAKAKIVLLKRQGSFFELKKK